MSIARAIGAEWLDELDEQDPAAIRSRRDLRRVHRVMGTRSIFERALRTSLGHDKFPALQVLELGAGDGSVALDIAGLFPAQTQAVTLTLLDRQELLAPATAKSFTELGWSARARVMDVFDWAGSPTDPLLAPNESGRWDLILASLFLHHFEAAQLGSLLGAIESRTEHFLACEPRRAWFPLLASHLIGAIGVNAVTRHDAVLSVRAGFRDAEIGSLWPSCKDEWLLEEYAAGPFSHCFSARRSLAARGSP